MQNLFNRIFMILMLACLLFLTTCQRDERSCRGWTHNAHGWIFEGWSCQPQLDQRDRSPAEYCYNQEVYDYLYLKFYATSSLASQVSGRVAMKQATCRENARLQIQVEGLNKLLADHLQMAVGLDLDESNKAATKILENAPEVRASAAIYDCCSINTLTGRCANPANGELENWHDCQCVGYIQYPGGQKKFEEDYERLQK